VIRPPTVVDVAVGPLLLAGVRDGPGLVAHQSRFGALPPLRLEQVLGLTRAASVRGRGGAGFPLARKIRAVAKASGRRPGRRPIVVVNAAEGEPASAKDSALLEAAPHLVLDGAAILARALRATELHVVTSAERPWVGDAVAAALQHRDDAAPWRRHTTTGRFVSGQARAVVELVSGRPNVPVTTLVPEAESGVRGRPTLLANAETFAHLAALVRVGAEAYAALGHPDEPGTTVLTLAHPPGPDGTFAGTRVVEVGHGSAAIDVLDIASLGAPLLVGGFHGSWLHSRDLYTLTWSTSGLGGLGATLGAGVVIGLRAGDCAVAETARYTSYLAAQSAGRCGPCRNGLPALAAEVAALAGGSDTSARIRELTGLVEGRGACAHPDGTARLVTTLLTNLPDAVQTHLDGGCGCRAGRAEVA
jgi:NADH:ubiquinone oxidoreductase subunit F (NADH-binding)